MGKKELLLILIRCSCPGFVPFNLNGAVVQSSSPLVQPSLAGYVLFFAALFGIRRWWWQADAFRSKRFRLSSVAFFRAGGVLRSRGVRLPAELGSSLGVAISAVVQLSAPWVTVKDRPAVVAAKS